MSSVEESYLYLRLKDALSAINQKVNLMGAVSEFKQPQKSKGTDWFCTLKITDESYEPPGLLITIFAESLEKLPLVKSTGDIILLFRIKMTAFHGMVNLNFHKQFSTFALFDGRPCNNFVPYRASSNFPISKYDKEAITRLRIWFVSLPPDSGTNEPLSFLREMKEGEYCNLVSKILHVSEDSKMLFVWDGSDAPPLACQSRLSDEMERPLPLQFEPLPLSRDVVSTFPRVGTILRVNVEHASHSGGLHLLHSGMWVKFFCIMCKCEGRFGLWYGVLGSSSKVEILSNEDISVERCQNIFKERIHLKWGYMPLSSFPWTSRITETENEDVAFVTLMHVLFSRKVIGKFKCVVRVVAMCPWKVEDFRSPEGACLYRMRLTLEDPTARIHALVYAEDGETFFSGYPSMDLLAHKRNKLLGISEEDFGKEDDARRNPPWIQCCLKSYPTNKEKPWESRQYRIFGTKLTA